MSWRRRIRRGVLLLPVFVAVFGARDAVAILTVVQLVSNGSRVWMNRKEVEYRVVGVFASGAVPPPLSVLSSSRQHRSQS